MKNKQTANRRFALDLTKVERQALSLIRPFDPHNIDPVLYDAASPDVLAIYSYFRVALSSAEQGVSDGIGRSARYIMIDRVSGAFLGLFCLASPTSQIPLITRMCGWDEHVPMDGRPRTNNAFQFERYRSVLKLTRCIPLFEFGNLLGGKLLAMAAINSDIVRLFEVKYSLPFVAAYWTTLHGKASQYSRLEAHNIRLVGTDEFEGRERGVYWADMRKGAVEFLSGKKNSPGKIATPNYADTLKEWTDRWYAPRLERLNITGLITPEVDQYRVSDKVKSCLLS